MKAADALRPAYRWELLVWLWFAYFLNQADRQVYSVVLPQLRAELHLNDVQAGLVATLFSVFFAVCVPVAGWAGDRWDRKKIIVLALLGWSLATLLTGLATGIVFLILVRSLATGAGEAFYGPSAMALISSYHVETRSRAISIHQTSLYTGVIGSGFLAGWIADHYGWRWAFAAFGGAGLLLGALAWNRLLPAPRSVGARRPAFLHSVKHLLGIPSVRRLAAAFGCMVFVNVGYLTWMPTYLHERFHLNLAQAGLLSMLPHHLLAFAGVAIGGWAADRMALRNPRRRLDLQAFGLLGGAPVLCLLGLLVELTPVLIALAVFGVFRGVYDSNIHASLYEVVEPHYRSTAAGLMSALAFFFGGAAPVTLGWIKQSYGLAAAFPVCGIVYLLGAGCIAHASWRHFRTDCRHARPAFVTR